MSKQQSSDTTEPTWGVIFTCIVTEKTENPSVRSEAPSMPTNFPEDIISCDAAPTRETSTHALSFATTANSSEADDELDDLSDTTDNDDEDFPSYHNVRVSRRVQLLPLSALCPRSLQHCLQTPTLTPEPSSSRIPRLSTCSAHIESPAGDLNTTPASIIDRVSVRAGVKPRMTPNSPPSPPALALTPPHHDQRVRRYTLADEESMGPETTPASAAQHPGARPPNTWRCMARAMAGAGDAHDDGRVRAISRDGKEAGEIGIDARVSRRSVFALMSLAASGAAQ